MVNIWPINLFLRSLEHIIEYFMSYLGSSTDCEAAFKKYTALMFAITLTFLLSYTLRKKKQTGQFVTRSYFYAADIKFRTVKVGTINTRKRKPLRGFALWIQMEMVKGKIHGMKLRKMVNYVYVMHIYNPSWYNTL